MASQIVILSLFYINPDVFCNDEVNLNIRIYFAKTTDLIRGRSTIPQKKGERRWLGSASDADTPPKQTPQPIYPPQ